jgi:hypothetical protein
MTTRDDMERMLANPRTHVPTDRLRELASAVAALWPKAQAGDREAFMAMVLEERRYMVELGNCERRAAP